LPSYSLGDSCLGVSFWSLVGEGRGCESVMDLGFLEDRKGVEQFEEREETDEPTAEVVEDCWQEDLPEFGELVSFSFDEAKYKHK